MPWNRYKKYLCSCPSIGLTLDISRMNFDDGFFARMNGPMDRAFAAMDQLEAGAIANPDENRMVGHYWLRDPGRAPLEQLRRDIPATVARIKQFVADVHSGRIAGAGRFDSRGASPRPASSLDLEPFRRQHDLFAGDLAALGVEEHDRRRIGQAERARPRTRIGLAAVRRGDWRG